MSPRTADVSVIVCAYTLERWDDLVAATGSLAAQSRPPREVIVVIDHNELLLQRARRELPGVRVVPNAGPAGLSGARNTGVAEARGRLVAFLDDDAVADPGWLDRLEDRYADVSVLGAGGKVEPLWDDGRPAWFPEEFDWVVGCTYRGMDGATTMRNMIGANMSFRRDLLVEAGGFRESLGRTADQPLGCEETDVCIRIAAAHPDGHFAYEPGALVLHHVPRQRGAWSYFSRRCWSEGISKAVLTRSVGSRAGLSSERAHVVRTLPAGVARGLADGLRGDGGGPARAAAIVGGLAATVAGFAVGTIRRPAAEPAAAAAPSAEVTAAAPPDGARRPTGSRADRRSLAGRASVLMVTPRFLPLMGGVENHVHQVAMRAPDDIRITVLTTDTTRQLPAHEVIEGVEILRVPAWPARRDYYVAPRIVRAIEEGEWDIVHVQSYHTAVAPLAMTSARHAGLPYVLTFHGGGHSSPLRRALREPQYSALRPLLAGAERLIAVAEFEADFFAERLRIPRSTFAVIPNGSDLPRARGTTARSSGRTVIASVGRLERYKGHHRVVEAMPALLARRPDVELYVLGEGPYRPAIERLVDRLGLRDHVHVGAIPGGDRAAMAEMLGSLSLTVLMSDFETHPLSVLEAVAAGCPALVADNSGLREMAQRGLAVAIPSDSGPDRIAEEIAAALEHPVRPSGVALPSWDDCAKGIFSVYREILASARVAQGACS